MSIRYRIRSTLGNHRYARDIHSVRGVVAWAVLTPGRWVAWMWATTPGRLTVLVPAAALTVLFLVTDSLFLVYFAMAAGAVPVIEMIFAPRSGTWSRVGGVLTAVVSGVAVTIVVLLSGLFFMLVAIPLAILATRRGIAGDLVLDAAFEGSSYSWHPFKWASASRHAGHDHRHIGSDQQYMVGGVYWLYVTNDNAAEETAGKIRPALLVNVDGGTGVLWFFAGTSQEKRAGQPGYLDTSRMAGWPHSPNGKVTYLNVREQRAATPMAVREMIGMVPATLLAQVMAEAERFKAGSR